MAESKACSVHSTILRPRLNAIDKAQKRNTAAHGGENEGANACVAPVSETAFMLQPQSKHLIQHAIRKDPASKTLREEMQMHTGYQKTLLWISIVCLFFTMIGLGVFARFIPVPGAYLSPSEVAEIYQSRAAGIRFGSVLMMLGGAATGFLMATIAGQMKRISGLPPSLINNVILFGGANVVFNVLPGIFFALAAFRPERPIEITASLNDLAWLFTVMNASSFIMVQIPLAMACFLDKSEHPVLPRWLGYVNIWSATIYVPAFGAIFFKVGPFAWHGILAFYLAAGAGLAWTICMYVAMFRAVNQEALAVSAERSPILQAAE